MKLVNAETLAAAIDRAEDDLVFRHVVERISTLSSETIAAAILAAIPPDPRLDALLEMAAGFMAHCQQTDKTHTSCVEMFALRDALAAFDD